MEKIILFGDSITAGYSPEGISGELTDRIQAAVPGYEIRNAGIPGDTTFDALKRIEEHVSKHQPKLVVVFFGANDVALHNAVSLEEYRENLLEIIQKIGKENVILLTAPYADQGLRVRDRPLSDIKEYGQVVHQIGQEQDILVVDVLAEMLEDEDPTSLLQEDGLHFSAQGYDLLQRIIVPGINQKINLEKKE